METAAWGKVALLTVRHHLGESALRDTPAIQRLPTSVTAIQRHALGSRVNPLVRGRASQAASSTAHLDVQTRVPPAAPRPIRSGTRESAQAKQWSVTLSFKAIVRRMKPVKSWVDPPMGACHFTVKASPGTLSSEAIAQRILKDAARG